MKKLIYLIQGQSNNLEKYLFLNIREDVDVIFLSYDEEVEYAIYFPNSTWAEGRNKLLSEAQKKHISYDYYIFCDDDVEFISGGFDEFEICLKKYNPAIAVPVVPRTKKTTLKVFRNTCQSFLFNDEQMMAFHSSVVEDRVVIPYSIEFDQIHWWATCQIQEILIQTFYNKTAVQFNTVSINNVCHGRYDSSEGDEKKFRAEIRDWLSTQFKTSYVDIRERTKKSKFKKIRNKVIVIYRTICFFMKGKKTSGPCNLGMLEISEKLHRNSSIYKRINSLK